jgi:STAS-like domain of unknown function (DUF4325)
MKQYSTITIGMIMSVGSFAENKDLAREIRLTQILPALREHKKVILDFSGVTSTTQSFVHALISELIRDFGPDVLDRIIFKSCNDTVKKLVLIVIEYMQYEEEPTDA